MDYSIAKTVGSSVSTVSTVATIAGIALAPFTGGWSLGLTIGGISGSILGGGTVLTTKIIETTKTKEWADELQGALDARAFEFKRIGEKIINHPTWVDYTKRASSGTVYLATKVPSGIALSKMIQYLIITARNYGLVGKDGLKLAAFMFSRTQFTGTFLFTNNLLRMNLSRMGLHASRTTLSAMQGVTIALGVVGIGLDVYTIVDTWASDPGLLKEVDEIIKELQNTVDELQEFENTFR
jgi:hypothetical protein